MASYEDVGELARQQEWAHRYALMCVTATDEGGFSIQHQPDGRLVLDTGRARFVSATLHGCFNAWREAMRQRATPSE